MSKAVLVARILLGLIFLVFGLNFFFEFFELPQPSEAGGAFLGALGATGYFFYLLKVIEILCGALLLAGRFVPLALVLLAPIVVNIFLYHLFLDPAGLPLAILILVLELFLAWAYWPAYAGVLDANAGPRS